MQNHRCYVCGFPLDDHPWGSKWVFEDCPCCGVQFSYEDATAAAVTARRAEWIAAGYPWMKPGLKPMGWSPEAQLASVPTSAPSYPNDSE